MASNISEVRQLLAESRFVEVQKAVELIFLENENSETSELLELYLRCLKSQSKILPLEKILDLVEFYLPTDAAKAQNWMDEISAPSKKDEQRILLIQIQLAEKKGKTKDLHDLISRYQLLRFESHAPAVPELVSLLTQKYFHDDFQLQLQVLAMNLLRMDYSKSETLILKLIYSCFERSSPKGTKDKLRSLYQVMSSAEKLHTLEVYKNFCYLMSEGISDKKDYKKIIELIIYTEEFEFQALILNFLFQENLKEIAETYSMSVRENKKYTYVYFDKFFPHLKQFFFQKPKAPVLAEIRDEVVIDLTLTKSNIIQIMDESRSEIDEEEVLLSHLLKHQSFLPTELLDIAVSFMQSEFYYAALKASQLAINDSKDNALILKAIYLKITCLLKTGDFRSALDLSLEALGLAQTQNDFLSFLYAQAEAHLRLKETSKAKSTLKKILSIDSSYRLAKERLDKLNAI